MSVTKSPITQTRVSRYVVDRLEFAVETLGLSGHNKKQRATDLLLTEAMDLRQVPRLQNVPSDAAPNIEKQVEAYRQKLYAEKGVPAPLGTVVTVSK